MATIRVDRLIAAGPTSTALLLAGPTALGLWPGVSNVAGSPASRWVDVDVPALAAHPSRVHVRALPPRRLTASYVSRFGFGGDALPETVGDVRLSYAGGAPVATVATLTLTWTPAGTRAERARVAAAFRAMAHGFLANLATAAEERSYAA